MLEVKTHNAVAAHGERCTLAPTRNADMTGDVVCTVDDVYRRGEVTPPRPSSLMVEEKGLDDEHYHKLTEMIRLYGITNTSLLILQQLNIPCKSIERYTQLTNYDQFQV